MKNEKNLVTLLVTYLTSTLMKKISFMKNRFKYYKGCVYEYILDSLISVVEKIKIKI